MNGLSSVVGQQDLSELAFGAFKTAASTLAGMGAGKAVQAIATAVAGPAAPAFSLLVPVVASVMRFTASFLTEKGVDAAKEVSAAGVNTLAKQFVAMTI
jgi:hypothetical protein